MNALTTSNKSGIPALAMDETELIGVLTNSLYPGAEIASVKMVIAYCKASQLDPMQKPVHIVPMWDSKLGRSRDVIMPGVGLYRTQAARSGNYAGVSEPEFGPETTENIGGVSITYPAWCKVSVKRLLPNGSVVDFIATEFWKENYAVKGGKEKSIAPNAMWQKRPFAQIAKCAEAQALRKAFPEVGAAPTADEMEGKEIVEEKDVTPQVAGTPAEPQPLPPYPAESMAANIESWRKSIRSGKATSADIINKVGSKYTLSPAQQAQINALEDQSANVIEGEYQPVDNFVSEMDAEEARQ